jgi:hypothetical protein
MRRAALLWIVLVTACSSDPGSQTRTGAVVGGTGPLPGAISGLRYTTGGHEGYTDEDGRFTYEAGDTVQFAFGPIAFQPVVGRARVSPFQLANGEGCAVGAPLTTVLQLLQSADSDANLDSGIQLAELPASEPVRNAVEIQPGELDSVLGALVPGVSVVAPEVALDRFIRQIDDEEWAAEEGDTFSLPDAVYRGQGVATDGKSWFFSSTNHLQRTNRSFTAQVDNAVPIPQDIAKLGGNHIGDIDVNGGLLYAPIENGPDYTSSYIVTYDAQTLVPTGNRYLLPQPLLTKGVPWVAVDGPRQRVYAAEWEPTERIQIFDLANDLASVGALELDTVIGRIQGAKVLDGNLYASSDDDDKTIYEIDLDTGTVMKRFALGTPGTEVEGLAPMREADGAHLRVLNVQIPKVAFADYRRVRDPLRISICP